MLVNVLYILVLLNVGSQPVTMQEFNSEESCRAAAQYILNNVPNNSNLRARCFRK